MAQRRGSPCLELSEKVQRPASVSTGPSLELCTFPSTLGSSVAAAALEQLFVVERSLQSDYFKCNEEARIFLKDIAVAVKKLEEMRKDTIDLLEIESMELSRLYFLLETFPDSISTELEECVRDARKLNLFEISQLQMKVTRMNNEIDFLKEGLLELEKNNEALGDKQEALGKEHEKIVLSLNHMMGEKASTIIYINETSTEINSEKEETKLQKKCIQDVEEQTQKERTEYFKRKKKLTEMISEYEKLCDLKRQDTYTKKKELDKLRLAETKIKEKVTITTVVLSDHNLEIAQLQASITDWEKQVEEIKKHCSTLEDKIIFFKKNKEKLEDKANNEKNELLEKIKEMAEKRHKAALENKDLQDKLHTLTRQHKIVLQEEEKVLTQHRKFHDENRKQLAFIAQKENFLSQRKVDIKNMEEGLVTLTELHRATKEVYRKQVKILNENLERERQRCVLSQWRIACLQRKHAHWLFRTKIELQTIMDKIHATESKRTLLVQETNVREKKITEYLAQIEKISTELKQEEEKFIVKEKKLVQELSKYEEKFVKEMESAKIKEHELVQCLPHLQVAEEEYESKHRQFAELSSILTEQKYEQNLLNNQLSQATRDFYRYFNSKDKLKQELKQLRDQESHKTKSHFEILKNLEKEIYEHDLKAEALLLENKRLREGVAYLRKEIKQYAQAEAALGHISGDLSWNLIAHHTQYLDLWAEFHVTVKEFVHDSEEILQEIKNLIQKLCERDEKIEHISIWLQGSLAELRFLATAGPPEKKSEQKHIQNLHFPLVARIVKNMLTKKNDSKDTAAVNSKGINKATEKEQEQSKDTFKPTRNRKSVI